MRPQVEFDELVQTTKDVARRLDAVQEMTLDAEVQERTVEYRQLFRLIEKDLEAHNTTAASEEGSKEGVEEKKDKAEDRDADTERDINEKPPKSLDLLSPLFFNHSLGPLGAGAQAKVPQPVEVDLYEWIVPTESYVVLDSIDLASHPDPYDSPPPTTASIKVSTTTSAKAEAKDKARQAKQQREIDPFYIVDSSSRSQKAEERKGEEEEDVDKIPIVSLDELMAEEARKLETQIREKQQSQNVMMPQVVLEEEEMPELGEVKPKSVVKKKKGSKSKAAEVEVEGGEAKVVKVTKKKKKPAEKTTNSGSCGNGGGGGASVTID